VEDAEKECEGEAVAVLYKDGVRKRGDVVGLGVRVGASHVVIEADCKMEGEGRVERDSTRPRVRVDEKERDCVRKADTEPDAELTGSRDPP